MMCRELCRPCSDITCDLTQSCALKKHREQESELPLLMYAPIDMFTSHTYARRTMRPKRDLAWKWFLILLALALSAFALLAAAAWVIQLHGRMGRG